MEVDVDVEVEVVGMAARVELVTSEVDCRPALKNARPVELLLSRMLSGKGSASAHISCHVAGLTSSCEILSRRAWEDATEGTGGKSREWQGRHDRA